MKIQMNLLWKTIKSDGQDFLKITLGNSLAVQRLGLHTSTARGPGWIPGWGTKILKAPWSSQKMK